MSTFLQLTPQDPLVARDGRPFGAGQGQRMRGLPWLLPSVVAGSFRSALVKAGSRDFSDDIRQRLMQIAVAGAFPVHGGKLYLPAPNDAVAEPNENGKGIKFLHRVVPQPITGGCDLPEDGLRPVMLSESQASEEFKPAEVPAWWPVGKYAEWLRGNAVSFDSTFLCGPLQETRDHVCLDAERGAAAEGQIFATVGLNVTRLPRFGVDGSRPLHERLAEITLSVRITVPDSEKELTTGQQFGIWHPLGGERRLVHWQQEAAETTGWSCPAGIRSALATATKVRMVLATPAVFKDGWKPGWLTKKGLEGELSGVKLKLVGASNGRWKAVSGWSLAKMNDKGQLDPTGKPGPKPIRRMVPAGSVYFFEVEKPGDAAPLADLWLQSVSDDEQERRDGFGLATWGIW
jgi:CRISPR-associated protein Cmr3